MMSLSVPQSVSGLEPVGFDPLMHAATATWPYRPSCHTCRRADRLYSGPTLACGEVENRPLIPLPQTGIRLIET